MTHPHDPHPDLVVIDAWLDGESADPQDVDAALSRPEGRAYAIDVMALRGAMLTEVGTPPVAAPHRSRPWLAAAALFVMTAGGFMAGRLLGDGRPGGIDGQTTSSPIVAATSTLEAPEPTRLIHVEVDAGWRELAGGN